jgi:hypothetical protein
VNTKNLSGMEDPYQVDFPGSLTPEEVLKAIAVDMRRPITSIEGSANILADEKYREAWGDAIQWILRSVTLMKRVLDATDTYLANRQAG